MEKRSKNAGAIRGISVTPNTRKDPRPETVEVLQSAQQILHGAYCEVAQDQPCADAADLPDLFYASRHRRAGRDGPD